MALPDELENLLALVYNDAAMEPSFIVVEKLMPEPATLRLISVTRVRSPWQLVVGIIRNN